jgi:hypothetical protein
MWDDTPILFPSTELFPTHLVKAGELNNIHILPITYNEIVLGHILVGYKEPLVYNNFLKQYTKRLALALWNIHKHPSYEYSAFNLPDPKVGAPTPMAPSTNKNLATNDTILVQRDNTLHKVSVENILLFETEGRKTIAVLKNGRYEVKKNLSQLEKALKEQNFLRVSKSALINMSKVLSFTPDEDRTICATLIGKITVRVSRKHAPAFKNKLHTL